MIQLPKLRDTLTQYATLDMRLRVIGRTLGDDTITRQLGFPALAAARDQSLSLLGSRD